MTLYNEETAVEFDGKQTLSMIDVGYFFNVSERGINYMRK